VKRFVLYSLFILTSFSWTSSPPSNKQTLKLKPNGKNLIIVTIDGVRWQEVFEGANEQILNNPDYVSEIRLSKSLYWDDNFETRRKKIMPFLWNYIINEGQVIGNRNEGTKMNVANVWGISYPGYNEIFTGNTDITIATNAKKFNSNENILEYLNGLYGFKNGVVGFVSWDVFPYIFNNKRGKNNFLLNASYNYSTLPETENINLNKVTIVSNEFIKHKEATRNDALTFQSAKAYLEEHRPRVLFLGLGESDEMAHQKKYDLYLQKIQQSDQMIAELWQWVQTTEGYRNNTDLIITTDHGRGQSKDTWDEHGFGVKGCKQTWMALLGPDYIATNHSIPKQQIYQRDICYMIDTILGTQFRYNKN
jgi:Type I phosphodiesterase / nucleotide pyrophosphatase